MNIHKMRLQVVALCILTLLASVASASEYIKISDYFAIKKVSSFFGKDYTGVFVRRATSDSYQRIGTIENSHWDKPFSGAAFTALEMSVIAVSMDGKSLLYRHHGSRKKEGIYWYQIEKGDTFLYPEEDLDRRWVRYVKPLPKNIMVIHAPTWSLKNGWKFNAEDDWALYAGDASMQPLGLYGANSLHLAVYHNDFEKVALAIKQGKDIDKSTYWSYSPLDIAVKKGFDDIAVYLIEKGADFNGKKEYKPSGYHTTIEAAVFLQRWNVIEAIHKKGMKFNNPSLFAKALSYNHEELINDVTSFHEEDIPKMIKLLLNDGVNANAEGLGIIKVLLSTDWLAGTPVQLEILQLLLKNGVNPNALDSSYEYYGNTSEYYHNQTALHSIAGNWKWALDDGAKEIFDILAAHLPNLETKDKFGRTALQTAMLRPRLGDNYNKALYLIKLGADDSIEYLSGTMGQHTGVSIQQKITE